MKVPSSVRGVLAVAPLFTVMVVVLVVIALEPDIVAPQAAPAPVAVSTPSPVITRETTQIADGLTLTTLEDPVGPNRIFELAMEPSSPLTLDVTLAADELGSSGTLPELASHAGAIAAVNGDYGISAGRPLHLFAMDGELFQTSLINSSGKDFALSADERHAYFGRPDVSIVLDRPSKGTSFEIQKWNAGAPGQNIVAGYTSKAGGLEPAPAPACSARLLPDGERSWAPGQAGVQRGYTVKAVACGPDPMEVTEHSVVLSALGSGTRAQDVESLVPGERVRLTWSVGWPDVLDAIGGPTLLLQDGQVVTADCHGGYDCWRHPRTGVGVTADGTILMVVVDGRREGYSVGMKREEFAELMQDLGATDALALDGGGSSEMVVNGQIVNRPSNGVDRRLMSALVVLPGPDPDETL